MLTKLLKYEFKATARVMVPLYALAAFLACVAQMMEQQQESLRTVVESYAQSIRGKKAE